MDNFYIAEKMVEWKAKEMEQYFSKRTDEVKKPSFSRLWNPFRPKQQKPVCCCNC